ncbi:MAG: glycosyltransferase family 4 protein [Thermoplasmata archaeon]|nr:glycosyltransferase family 4 protein [Thermoplasmata archaeon]
MRVVEVTQRYPPALGGVEIHVDAIAHRLHARGHSVQIVTTDLARERPFTRLSTPQPEEIFPVRRHRAFRTIPAPHGLGIVAPGMALDLLTVRADVIHAHAFGVSPTWFASFARRLRPIPLVIETHADAGRGTSGSRAYARAVASLTLRAADRVVVQTHLEEGVLRSLGVDPSHLALIPDGIDLSEFSGWPERPRSEGGPTLLFVGRLSIEQKGLEPLVRGLAGVPSELGLRLRLVGPDWGGKSPVEALARKLGVEDRVTVTGPLPRAELLQEYARADLFVLPSLFEPYGIVLTEAMAAGLPIVASRVGGIPEVVAEGENALLCSPNDSEALTAAFVRLATDAPLRARFARAGVERVQRFSWSVVLPQWIALFESIISRRGA